MKTSIYIFFFLFCTNVHDFDIANFELSQKEETLHLSVKMDIGEMNSLAQTEVDTAFFNRYLKQNFKLNIDKENIRFTTIDIQKDSYFYEFHCKAKQDITEPIQHIQIQNTCLIHQVANHSNIIHFNLNDTYRTFRMHRERVNIELNY